MNPVDSGDAAVIFSHSFLSDRTASDHFPRLAGKYRSLGYATLLFDYSGHGESDDDPITNDLRVEDLRAASSWLADQGFGRQLLHAHSSGSTSAFLASPRAVDAIFVTAPITGPLSFNWEAIFSPTQLEELERAQRTFVPDDSVTGREYFEVTSQTLLDLSLNKQDELLANLRSPTYMLFDSDDIATGIWDAAQGVLPLLPSGSVVEVEPDLVYGELENLELLWDHAKPWALEQVPVHQPDPQAESENPL